MNIDQMIGCFAKLRERGSAAVDPCAAFALRIDAAAKQQIAFSFEACFM